MKILVFNGSPKASASNTKQLTDAFLQGFCEKEPAQIETLDVNKMNISPCIGCFSCWNKTPGRCRLCDDMGDIIAKILAADLIVYSFPLYYFSLPSQMKALIDRQLPLCLPFMETENNEGGAHLPRYATSGKRYVLISTCGFYSASGNYDGVTLLFDKMLGHGGYESIFCAQGELFRVPELKKRTAEYLEFVTTAGKELAQGAICAETKVSLAEPLYPKEVFERMADASWGIENSGKAGRQETGQSSVQSTKALSFTRQMAALYNKSAHGGRDMVLEMSYTDCEESYQIVLTQDGHCVLAEDFLPFTTKIETPLAVWQSIARGELDGQTALMERLYRVQGDFNLMLKWDEYFGSHKKDLAKQTDESKKTTMALLIAPWLSIWVFMTIDKFAGAVAAIACGMLLPFAYLKYKPTVYECLSVFSVVLIGLLALFGVESTLLVPASYLIFGLMWSATVFLKSPLTASYSMNQYGAEKALKNPLFMRTNRILTACWGALYLVMPIWTYALMGTPFPWITGIINSALPIILGVFTGWFQKWYPAYFSAKQ